MVAELKATADPLAADFAKADARAVAAARMARTGGDYPALSGGDINLYSLFVERAVALVKPSGFVGLVTPIGIGTDKTSAEFFSSMAETGRVKTFLAFENKRGWLFKDVHHEDQPTVIVLAKDEGAYADFSFGLKLHGIPDEEYKRAHRMTGATCRRINPNTGTIPIFRTARDTEITSGIYSRAPILVDRSETVPVRAWPVRYATMFHMTSRSSLFRRKDELEEKEAAFPIGGRVWDSARGRWYPLYEGKMISIYNHRYASVAVNANNVSGQGVAVHSSIEALSNPAFVNEPRYWVLCSNIPYGKDFVLSFNDICNTNNSRSLIGALVPFAAYGNKLPILMPDNDADVSVSSLLLANLNSVICDYVARQKIQSRNLNKYILEQIPSSRASASMKSVLAQRRLD